MVERRPAGSDPLAAPALFSEPREFSPPVSSPLAPLVLSAIEVLAAQTQLEEAYNAALKRLQRSAKKLTKCPAALDTEPPTLASPKKPRPFTAADLLPATRQLLENLDSPPLLSAPPTI